MLCPQCGKKTKVIDSRQSLGYVRRRRVCKSCKFRLSTREWDPFFNDLNDVDIQKFVSKTCRKKLRSLPSDGLIILGAYLIQEYEKIRRDPR